MTYPRQLSRSVAAMCKAIPVGIAALGLLNLTSTALAQSTTSTDPTRAPRVDAAEGFSSNDASGGLFGESGSAFNLIHRAVLMNERSLTDFSRQHRGRINSEATNFQNLQREALQRQAQPEIVTPATGEE